MNLNLSRIELTLTEPTGTFNWWPLQTKNSGYATVFYITALERSLGAILAQENAEGKEKALYYPSRTLISRRCHIPLLTRCVWHFDFSSKSCCIICNIIVLMISREDPLEYILNQPLHSSLTNKEVKSQDSKFCWNPCSQMGKRGCNPFLGSGPLRNFLLNSSFSAFLCPLLLTKGEVA